MLLTKKKIFLNLGLIPFGFNIIIVRENGNETIVQNNISEKNRGSINITLYETIIQRIHISKNRLHDELLCVNVIR